MLEMNTLHLDAQLAAVTGVIRMTTFFCYTGGRRVALTCQMQDEENVLQIFPHRHL